MKLHFFFKHPLPLRVVESASKKSRTYDPGQVSSRKKTRVTSAGGRDVDKKEKLNEREERNSSVEGRRRSRRATEGAREKTLRGQEGKRMRRNKRQKKVERV